MKKVKISKIILEDKFQAEDGKIFKLKFDCEEHEKNLYFKGFKYNEKLTNGKLTKKNWQHYMYKFIITFHEKNYRNHIELMVEDKYHEIEFTKNDDYSKRERIDLGFKLSKVKSKIYQLYKTEFNKLDNDNFDFNIIQSTTQPIHNRYNTTQKTNFFYGEEHLLNVLNFFFVSELLNRKDLINNIKKPQYAPSRQDFYNSREIRNHQDDYVDFTKEEKNEHLDHSLFFRCYIFDSIKAMDIILKYIKPNVLNMLNNLKHNVPTTIPYSREMKDFISILATCGIDKNPEERIMWLEYFLDLDLPVKLFKKKLSMSIDNLIEDVKESMKNPKIFLFKKNGEKVIDILKNKSGKKLIKQNKNNKLDECYLLSIDTFKTIKEIFKNNPQANVYYREESDIISDIYYVFNESYPMDEAHRSNNHREDNSNCCSVYLKALESSYVKWDKLGNRKPVRDNIIHISNRDTFRDLNSDRTTIKILDLNDYLNRPKDLVTDLVHYLSNGELTPSSSKVNENRMKKLELEKKRKEIEKEIKDLENSNL